MKVFGILLSFREHVGRRSAGQIGVRSIQWIIIVNLETVELWSILGVDNNLPEQKHYQIMPVSLGLGYF